jgi:hypothetical protein
VTLVVDPKRTLMLKFWIAVTITTPSSTSDDPKNPSNPKAYTISAFPLIKSIL